MKCPSKEILTRFTDHELPGEEGRKLSFHLDQCPACKKQLQTLRREISLVSRKLDTLKPTAIPETEFSPMKLLPPAEPVKHIRQRLLDIFHTHVRIPVPAMASLLVLVFVLGTVLLLQTGKTGKQPPAHFQSQPHSQSTFFVVDKDKIETVTLDADLTGFKPIKKPRIFVTKEKYNE